MVALKILEAAEVGDISALERFQSEVTEELSDDQGANCMHYAARQNGCDILNFLVKKRGFSGKKRSNIGSTPAHDAAAAGNLEAVKWLLQHTGCEVNDQDGTGATMLHLACRFQHTNVTEWLVDEGHCDVMLRTASGGLALHFAVVGGDFEAVKILTDTEPRSVNFQTGNGATAVYLACQEGQFDILEFLIRSRRGNAIIKAYDGMSCLHAAAQSGHLDCVRFLVQDENSNPNERDFDGATPLHYAASRGQYKVIDWLLREGHAKITLDNIGGSPLHNAAETGQIRCIKILLDNGCSPDIVDNNGLTAAELARKCQHDSCADLIQSYVSQDLQDPDYDYLQQVQSPRPQLIHHYLSNYNGVPEPQRAVSPSRAPLNIADSRSRSPTLYTPSATPETPESPRRLLDPAPDYSTANRVRQNEENIFLATKSPTRRLVDYLKEPVLDLHSETEPDNYPVPDYKDNSVEKLQPADVLVRPPSPDIDYSFRGRRSPTYDRIGADRGSRDSIASHLSAQADSTEFLHGNRRSVSDLDLLDKPPSLSSSVSSLSDHSHLDDLIAFTSGVLKGQGQINGKGGQPEALIYKCEAKANQGARGRTHPPKPSRAFQKANSVPLIQVSEVKGGYQHLVYNECERNGNPNYVNVPIATNTLNVDKEMDRPPSEYLFRDVVIEERNGNQDLKTRNEGREETKTESLPVDSVQTNGSVVTNGDLNGNVDGVKIVVNSASKTLDAKQTILTQPPVPVPPPLPSIIATSEIVANGHNTAPPAPPPPPPPAIPSQPPPTSRAQTTPQLVNGVTPTTASGADNSVKPPRPVSLFSQEDIASKRNSLNHTQQRPASVTSPMANNSNFIEELKLATKSSTLRRTSTAGIGPGESQGAKMVFSSTNGPVVNGIADKSKGENGPIKTDLTGEFDPKNFVDQVPNKDNLPSWKVQLLARQIAEKSMKDTLEHRKKEAEENRFKNMPPWKRALVEKKEAEARALEERKQQEEEQKVVSSKRVPTVSVLAKSDGASLAPWQRELQGK